MVEEFVVIYNSAKFQFILCICKLVLSRNLNRLANSFHQKFQSIPIFQHHWSVFTAHRFCFTKKVDKNIVMGDIKKVSDAVFERALRVKSEGNNKFAIGSYPAAIKKYNEALTILGNPDPNFEERVREEASKMHSNLAEIHLRKFEYETARDAATESLKLDAANFKSLFRRGTAYLQLGDALCRKDLYLCKKVQEAMNVNYAATDALLRKTRPSKETMRSSRPRGYWSTCLATPEGIFREDKGFPDEESESEDDNDFYTEWLEKTYRSVPGQVEMVEALREKHAEKK